MLDNDVVQYGEQFGVLNSTRRRIAFRFYFRVVNEGPGQAGVRKRLPACVETGVRAIFPDAEYMGFREA